jgi:hypothetical protein
MASRADERFTGPPDYVGVGAYRSATAGWYGCLLEHPEIERVAPGQGWRHFFDDFCVRPMEDADVARYHADFPRRPGQVCGEWRPRYMYDPWTPRLLKRAAPEAKLLVLLGDPIARYRVNLAAELALDRERDQERYMPDIVGRARYATQLRRLRECFAPERILVLQHERCRDDPVGQYRRTLAFLGVDPEFLPPRQRRRRGGEDDRDLRFPTPGETVKRRLVQALTRRRDPEPPPLWPDLVAALHEELDAEMEQLQELVPDLDVSLWPHFREG